MPFRSNINKLQTILARIALSPYFISLVLSALIILLVPVSFPKYKINILDSGYPEKTDGKMFFEDMDNDGNSEELIFFHNIRDEAAFKITDHNGNIIGQWDLSGIFPGAKGFLCFGDYDHNNIKEILLLTYSNDSLFLNCYDYEKKDFIFTKRFIKKISRYNDKIDFILTNNCIHDLNSDGFDEFIFNVNAGFSIQPRMIFAYNILQDTLYASKLKGSMNNIQEIADLNGDCYPEILLNCGAPGNMPQTSNIPYSDNSSWLMILDHKLGFLFEPIEFKGKHTNIGILHLKDRENNLICALFCNESSSDDSSKLMICNISGEVIHTRNLSKDNLYDIFIPSENDINSFYLIEKDKNIKKIDTKLNILEVYDIEVSHFTGFELDVDGDLDREMIYINKSNRLVIIRNDLSHPVFIDLPVDIAKFFNYSIVLKEDKYPSLFVQTIDMWYVLEYKINRIYYWTIPLWVGIYLAFLIFILLIQKIQRIRFEKEQKTRKKITELQLKSTKGQLDPHFVYNALNAMGTMFYQGEREEADKFFSRFSKLIRNTLDHSDNISVTLKEELDFVEIYIKLQRTRFDNKFDYKIDISKDVNLDQIIPKLLIQTFVENAIKHGLSRKEKEGLLIVSIKKANKAIQIQVDDNGIGFEQAKQHAFDSTGKGLKIVDQILELYKTINDCKISYKIINKGEIEGETGTRVEVTIECDNA